MKRALLRVGTSQIAGLGAFAQRSIPKGTRIIEYLGERIPPAEADRRYASEPANETPVLLFSVDDRTVIDAGAGGNEARFINHSCEPNCEAVTERGRIWIYALREIHEGEELTYDYHLIGDDDLQTRMELYRCNCGAAKCRGTLYSETGRVRPHPPLG